MENVNFKYGTKEEYDSITPDEHTFYRLDSTGTGGIDEVYLGTELLSNEADIKLIYDKIEEIKQSIEDLKDSLKYQYFFDGYTYDQVKEIVDSGEAANIWSVGETSLPVRLNGTVGNYNFDKEDTRCTIIGFDHNPVLETDNRHSMTLQFNTAEDGTKLAYIDDDYNTVGSSDGFRMNLTDTNTGGWASSYMRNTICEEFYNVLPSNLQKIISTTTKYTDNVANGASDTESNITATEDKIFLVSDYEVIDADGNANPYEANYTEQYSDYYGSDSDRVRYRHSLTSASCSWWLRSPRQNHTYNFDSIGAGGAIGSNTACVSSGFAPVFNIISSEPGPIKTWTIDIIAKDYEDNILAGAEYEIDDGQYSIWHWLLVEEGTEDTPNIYQYDSNGEVDTIVSSEGGIVVTGIVPAIEEIPLRLTVVSAPDGYNLLSTPLELVLHYNGTIEIENGYSSQEWTASTQDEPYHIAITTIFGSGGAVTGITAIVSLTTSIHHSVDSASDPAEGEYYIELSNTSITKIETSRNETITITNGISDFFAVSEDETVAFYIPLVSDDLYCSIKTTTVSDNTEVYVNGNVIGSFRDSNTGEVSLFLSEASNFYDVEFIFQYRAVSFPI